MGLILLGLWGMLALLLGASVGMESNYHRTVHLDLEPGFGETHATRHHRNANGYAPNVLPPPCLGKDCPGIEQTADTAYPGPPRDDAPGEEVDDATSAIGRPRGPETPPPTQGGNGDPVPNWLFVPQGPPGGSNPGGPDIGNPIPGGPNIDNPPQNPDDTPPPNFTQPPFSNPPGGPDGPGGPDAPNGPNSPQGPDGPAGPDGPPNGGQQPDPPQQLPEPLTFSLFVGGLAGSILLRRRRDRSSK